jgi:hypothetical protein
VNNSGTAGDEERPGMYRMASCCADLGDMGRRPGQQLKKHGGRESPFLLFWRPSSVRSRTP